MIVSLNERILWSFWVVIAYVCVYHVLLSVRIGAIKRRVDALYRKEPVKQGGLGWLPDHLMYYAPCYICKGNHPTVNCGRKVPARMVESSDKHSL